MRDLSIDPRTLDAVRWASRELPGEGPDRTVRERVREAIDALPATERNVVNGIFYERTSRRELARRLGRSRADVERTLRKALRRLRGKLEALEAEPPPEV